MTLFFILLSALMALVIVLDAWKYIIPNWLVGLVVLLWPVMLYMSGWATDWKMGLAAGAGMFAVGFALFSLKLMGGGDVKLLAALSLWTGVAALADFLLFTALLGGALTVLLLAVRPLMARVSPAKAMAGTLPRLLTKGAPVPYGLAIAVAFLVLLWSGKVAGLV